MCLLGLPHTANSEHEMEVGTETMHYNEDTCLQGEAQRKR